MVANELGVGFKITTRRFHEARIWLSEPGCPENSRAASDLMLETSNTKGTSGKNSTVLLYNLSVSVLLRYFGLLSDKTNLSSMACGGHSYITDLKTLIGSL